MNTTKEKKERVWGIFQIMQRNSEKFRKVDDLHAAIKDLQEHKKLKHILQTIVDEFMEENVRLRERIYELEQGIK